MLGSAGDRDPDGPNQVAIMVVVPRWNGIYDAVARIDERAVGRVETGTRPARDDDRTWRDLESQPPLVEAGYRFAQRHHAFGRRIVRFASGQCLLDSPRQQIGDPELGRIEIANGKVAHRLAALAKLTDLCSDPKDF